MNPQAAIVCRNGHVICEAIRTFPQRVADFCEECGEAGVRKCDSCDQEIQGYDFVEMETVSPEQERTGMGWTPPRYCPGCGHPYPWTQKAREAITEAIQELEDLTAGEREQLLRSVPDIVADTPKSETAVLRYKKALAKLGRDTATVMQNVITAVATEAVKKMMGM